MFNIEKYKIVQNIAKQTMEEIKFFIKPGVTEFEVANEAEKLLKTKGINKFWYYNIGAFVLIGDRSTLSVSGKHYTASDKSVQQRDIITIDLSPELDNCWGDYARSFVVYDGQVYGMEAEEIKNIDQNSELYQGMKVQDRLHEDFIKVADPLMCFEEVYEFINNKISDYGSVNLDFSGNLGHTIETKKEDRIYFEAGNKTKLKEVNLFTFEPHVKRNGGQYGFKKEDIYYFENNVLRRL